MNKNENKADYAGLYGLQDQICAVLRCVDTGLYLTGGTAASRVYLHHRYSDDLDFFADDDTDFPLWTSRVIEALRAQADFTVSISLNERRFVRILVEKDGLTMKLEMVNDVPARVGAVVEHPIFGRVDTAENILANKITAVLDRDEPKDYADIWGFCTKLSLSLSSAIEGAQGKAAGIFPADLARALDSATVDDWARIKWIDAPAPADFVRDLKALSVAVLLQGAA
jgi:hypothetical protein